MLMCCSIHGCSWMLLSLANSICLFEVNVSCYIWVTCSMRQVFTLLKKKKTKWSVSQLSLFWYIFFLNWPKKQWWSVWCVVCYVNKKLYRKINSWVLHRFLEDFFPLLSFEKLSGHIIETQQENQSILAWQMPFFPWTVFVKPCWGFLEH